MIWATVSSKSCFCWRYRASPSLAAKNIINLILVLTIWWCPCVESSSQWLENHVCYMTSMFSCQNFVSFCPASFCTPRPNLPAILVTSLFPTFAFQSPMMKRTSFFLVLVLEVLIDLHRTSQLQLLHISSWARLGLLWCWMVCLGNEQRSFCHFRDCTQVLHFKLFWWLWRLLHFF